jgi:hypothetical protein
VYMHGHMHIMLLPVTVCTQWRHTWAVLPNADGLHTLALQSILLELH